MIFKCRYCKITFDCKTFEDIEKRKKEQCYITKKGVPHDIKPYFPRRVKK